MVFLIGILFLVGCSSNNDRSPKDIYSSIERSVQLPAFIEMDEEYLTDYYNLDFSRIEDFVYVQNEDSLKVDTIIIIETKDRDYVDFVKITLNNILEQMRAETQSYSPENYNIIKKSEVVVSGNLVYLVMSKDYDQIVKIIN